MSISWLRIIYLSTVIPHTIINELLAGTVPLENYLPQLVQQKMRKTYMVVLLLLSLNAYPCFISGELTQEEEDGEQEENWEEEGNNDDDDDEDYDDYDNDNDEEDMKMVFLCNI